MQSLLKRGFRICFRLQFLTGITKANDMFRQAIRGLLIALAICLMPAPGRAEEVVSGIQLESPYGPYLGFSQTTAMGKPAVLSSWAPSIGFTWSKDLEPTWTYMSRDGFGINTTPQVPFHVVKRVVSSVPGIVTGEFRVTDDAFGRLQFDNPNTTAFVPRIIGRSASANAALILEGQTDLDTGTGPVIVHNTARISGGGLTTRPLVVYRNNGVAKVTVSAAGIMTATSFHPASSRTLKRDICTLDSRQADLALEQLTPVRYIYKDDADAAGHVGFIAEDVPELVATPDRKSVPVTDVIALVTRVVKDQQQVIESQQQTIETRQILIESRLTAIEQAQRTLQQQQADLEAGRVAGDEQQKLIDELTARVNALQPPMEQRGRP